MSLKERVLYHQIHPAKLATDILAELVSLYFLWRHQLALGLATHFAPPLVASAILVAAGDFDRQKRSALGRYIAWHMTRSIEAARLGGDIIMAIGAWYHSPAAIIAGLLIVVIAWSSGRLRGRRPDG